MTRRKIHCANCGEALPGKCKCVTLLHPVELSVPCPVCDAQAQQQCSFDVDYLTRRYHLRRIDKLWQRRR